MSLLSTARRILPPVAPSLIIGAFAAILASCTEAPPAVVAPPPPPPPPAVALSPKVIELASVYRAYVARAASITPTFSDGQAVAASLRAGASYEPQQLMRGAIAYGAVAALQDPAFVAGVRTYVGDAEQRQKIAYEILKDPAYAVGITGSASAAGLVVKALGDDGQRLYDQGKQVKQSAYDIQKQPWSKADVAGREARLIQMKQVSGQALMGEMGETTRLTQAVSGATPLGLSPNTVSPPYTPLVIRSLAVAALAALGQADDSKLEQVMPLMAETAASSCMTFAKLNLYQCLAVAKPHYEDIFCLGEHIMMDTGRCLLKGAGVRVPEEPRFIPVEGSGKAYAPPPVKKAPAKKPAPRKKA